MSARVWVAVAGVTVALSGCRAASTPPAVTATRSGGVVTPATAPTPAGQRQRWLEMFARGYFPGRSGQIFVVPREGEIITYHDPLYTYMHGSPWSYDVRIPMLLSGAPFIRQGRWPDAVGQQDVAPTLGALLGVAPAATMTGHVLRQAIDPSAGTPRVIILFVLDAMRADYFDRYAEVMPTLSTLRREGAWFSNAQINYLPTVTSVGHATVGTGTDPRIHGQASNTIFSRITGKPQQAYDALDPGELMALTLADTWNLATDGQAIIIGQGGAIRATAGLVGRGACLVNGRRVMATSYNAADGGWETNPDCYRMPDYLKALNARSVWEAAGGTWMGHDISNPSKFRASSLFQRFEGNALAAVAEHEALGADPITDLLLVNMKGPDYSGHAYGPDSPELKETLAELDRQVARVLEVIDRKAGPRQRVVAVTADHGMPPEPPAGHRRYFEEIVNLIHERFDPDGKAVVQYYGDPANSQIYIDTARLKKLGFTLKDVATLLTSQEYYAAAFTEEEVQAAGRTLK